MAGAGRIARAFGDAELVARLADQATPPVIRAYHGSPHDFDKFDASKIGTGEGAQAYGHGLYFAGSEPTAEVYRKSVSALHRTPQELDFRQPLPKRPGHMYEVEIDAPEESLLDWDASVHDQNMNAQAVFGNVRDQLFWPGAKAKYAGAYLDSDQAIRWNQAVMTGRPKGMDLWHAASVLEGPDSAAQFLASQGIPGIRYLDQGSRSAGEGTRNYVMFPGTEDSISILRKYGLLPATLGAEGLVNQQPPGE
jgi:hypothetical protein